MRKAEETPDVMTKLAMAIDLQACIGCHACTIACKSEHHIPIGVWRCWVKEVEKGHFPHTRREFLPVLCNQCDDAPCQNICPTRALFRREDGIVDLDPDWCIGCKSCIAACPYDQLFIDPNTATAEKCNFCANRLEVGLEPACVVVCPTQCRIFGDIDDAESNISRRIAHDPVSVRKEEYATGPNIYYLEGSRQTLGPAVPAQSGLYKQGEMDAQAKEAVPKWENRPGESRTTYNTFHVIPWGTNIIGYLMSKGMSTGLFVLSLLMWNMGFTSTLFTLWMPVLSGLLLAATGALLILDLKRPERFYYILLRPNLKSWMTWGTYFILVNSILIALWVLAALFGAVGWMGTLLWPGVLSGILASIYTGFFFAQASARDLWKGSENTLDIAAQSTVKGAAVLLLFAALFPIAEKGAAIGLLSGVLAGALTLHLLILIFAILAHRFGSPAHERALEIVRSGGDFWWGALGLGCVLPLLLLAWFGAGSGWLAGILGVIGAYYWDRIWVRAGQAVPLS